MHYELTTKDGLLKPKSALVLANLGDVALHNIERGLRHPLGIYNFTFDEFVSKSHTLLDTLEEAKTRLCQYIDYAYHPISSFCLYD